MVFAFFIKYPYDITVSKSKIQLSDHFDYVRLLKFTWPTVLMLVFTGIYYIVDGLFISNFVGKTAFAAVNLIFPFLMIPSAIVFMITSGGSALVSKTMGEGNDEMANRLFTMLIRLTLYTGIVLTAVCLWLLEPVARFFGAEGDMLDFCIRYGKIMILGTVPYMGQFSFQPFFAASEKPKFGMWVTVIAGLTNMVGDAILVGCLKLNVEGAALASVSSQIVGFIIPLIYYSRKNNSRLRLTTPEWDLKAIAKTCSNGSSEMVTNLSLGIVNMLYNIQLMNLVGEDGVAAYGVIMYSATIFIYIVIGYAVGLTPIVGYHYGANNLEELHSLLVKSAALLLGIGAVLAGSAEILSEQVANIFVGFDQVLMAMTTRAFRIYSISYLILPQNILASAFFTGLNNGLVSAAISLSRTFVLQIASILLLPIILGLDGIWFATVAAESLSLIVSISCFAANRNRYGY